MSDYNYPSFPLEMDGDDFANFPSVLKVGGPAPDGELTNAGDGSHVRLSDYWRNGPLVIEFGSIT